MRLRALIIAPLLSLVVSGCFGDELPEPVEEPGFRLAEVASDLASPVHVAFAGSDASRMYVVEQAGRILLVQDGAVAADPVLDIRSKVRSGGERGLLSLAFAPGYPDDPQAYVYYNDEAGDTVVARLAVTDDGGSFDPETEEVLLTQVQPYANHNGGLIVFGPDGYLYVGLGDGGAAGDPQGNAQDTESLLGTILRIDVSGPGPYGVPSDNPFVGGPGRDEIWAWGLRNPWRFSFDRETADLWIGDVGQNRLEEIDLERAGSGGGRNYGWDWFEGSDRFETSGTPPNDLVFPVAEYSLRDGNCAVTGGYRYRGDDVPALEALYLFADYCSGRILALKEQGGWATTTLMDTDLRITSFAEDPEGEVYVVDHGGRVFRFVADGG